MFDFFRRPAPRPLSAAIRSAIDNDGFTAVVTNPASLRMVESGGRYSDRKVTYFRVFDPAATANHSLDVRRYKDLDTNQALIMRSGHVEQNGAVIVTRPVTVRPADSGVRMRAGRPVSAPDVEITSQAHEAASPITTTATPTS